MSICRKQTAKVKQATDNGLRACWRPPPLTAVEWANENFYLSAESSYLEGRWETLPFQVAILNSFGNDEVRVVNFMKSARVGYSQMLKAAIAYMLEHKNRNQLLLQPTDSAAAGFMKAHIETMIRDVPCVKTLAPWYGRKHRDNTLDTKRFSNKRQLWCLGGTAAKNYREKSVDTVIYDELAAFPHDVEREGSPTFLGDKRLEGSVFGKSIRGSTPKNKHECQIERACNESGITFRFELPCPHCDHYQYLKWGSPDSEFGMKWQGSDAASIAYLCESCGCLGTYAEWMPMQPKGIWRDRLANIQTVDGYHFQDLEGRSIDTPETISFHIWTAYSPFTEWKRMLQDWFKAKDDIGKLKSFVNTTLGEVWEDAGERLESHEIYRRREVYPAEVPQGGLVLVAAVDVQDDRLEVLVQAFGIGHECWSIDYQIMFGDLAKSDIWQELDQYLQSEFTHESGVIMRIACTAVDSGGHFTQQVYDFVRHKRSRRIFAIKGKAGQGRPLVSRPTTSNKGKIPLYTVGVDTAKEMVVSCLQILETGSGYYHFPLNNKFDEEFFKQLTAEERRIKYIQGRPVPEWHSLRKRNEAFDLSVYCLAARDILNPKYSALVDLYKVEKTEPETVKNEPEKTKQPRKKIRMGGFNAY